MDRHHHQVRRRRGNLMLSNPAGFPYVCLVAAPGTSSAVLSYLCSCQTASDVLLAIVCLVLIESYVLFYTTQEKHLSPRAPVAGWYRSVATDFYLCMKILHNIETVELILIMY